MNGYTRYYGTEKQHFNELMYLYILLDTLNFFFQEKYMVDILRQNECDRATGVN